jgi:hypothetical protein
MIVIAKGSIEGFAPLVPSQRSVINTILPKKPQLRCSEPAPQYGRSVKRR